MEPLKKTYLVRIEKVELYENIDGVIVQNDVSIHDLNWKGVIAAYGTGWTEEEKKDLLPIGTKVVMTYGKTSGDKGGVKLVMNDSVYMIREPEEIVGVIEE